jgi:hypothetical protein
LLAFFPILLPASAQAETKAEYDVKIAEAQAKVDAAQAVLLEAQNNLVAAQQLQNETNNAVSEAELTIQTKGIDANQKAEALEVAKQAVDQAQEDYDTKLIETPTENTEPTIPGLQADIYTFSSEYYYPERLSTTGTLCKTITVETIDKNWGGGDIEGCGGDFVMIHYTGFLTVPKTDNYEFHAMVDDGWYMTLDDIVINDNWVLKGCGGWWSQPIELEAGRSYRLDAWMYEYGGDACNQLLYMDSQTWAVVPADWLSQNQVAPVILTKDPALLALLEQAQSVYNLAVTTYEQAQLDLANAVKNLKDLQAKQLENIGIIDVAQQSVTNKEEELGVAQQELNAIPPFEEPTPTPTETEEPVEKPTEVIPEPIPEPIPTDNPEPSEPELPVDISTVVPQSLSEEQVAELVAVANEILSNSEQGSPEYEQALDALFVAAQADDIVISEELAAIPGAEALVGAINFMGNVGADMSPKVREESEKIVVTAVVAVGAAVNAATGAALTAAAPSAAATGSSGGTSIRRRI